VGGDVERTRDLDHIGPVRRTVYFLLGIAVIIDGIVAHPTNTSELWVGLILLGLIPVDTYVDRLLHAFAPPPPKDPEP
jgi:hypothetical protein